MHGNKIQPEQIEDSMITIKKNFKFAMKNTVLNMYEKGEIVLMISPNNIKLPTCMPFILTKDKTGRIIGVIDCGIYGTLDKDTDDLKIDPRKLYCIMEGAAFAKINYENSTAVSSRSPIITNGSIIYSTMFTRVLNKQYALNLDKSKLHKIILLSSKFFMINMLGMKDNDTTYNYALKNCHNANPLILEELNDSYPIENFNDISTFINSLSKVDKKNGVYFKDLTPKSYFEAYMNMYDSSALLGLESFPYFMYNVAAVVNGGYLNNQYILTDIVDTYGSKMYVSMMDIGKN
jgi:hypothetical protein